MKPSSYSHYPWSLAIPVVILVSISPNVAQKKRATNGPADMITASRTKQSWWGWQPGARGGVTVSASLFWLLCFCAGDQAS